MRKKNLQDDSRQITLTGRLEEFREALQDEIAEIEKSGQSSILLNDGKKLLRGGPGFWYQFKVTYVPTIPADTPCKLVIGDSNYDVTVVSFDDNSIIVSANESLPDTLAKARLENGSTILMERLIGCIEDNAEKSNQLGNCMFAEPGLVYSAKEIHSYTDLHDDSSINEEQNKAISTALTYDISYIWGPPGTGKTTVIGKLINELYKHNRSVLLVSHTNTAVDAAIGQADKALHANYIEVDSSSPYPILRLGNPVKQLPERILLKSHVDKAGAELYKQQEDLKGLKLEKEREISEISIVLAKFAWLRDSRIRNVKDLIDTLDKYDNEIRLSKTEIERLTAEKGEMSAAHPEYATYRTVLTDYSSLCLELDSLLSDRKKREKNLRDLEKQVEIALDEIKKHTLSAELRAKAGRYMSLSFLRGEINKAETAIKSLNNETTKLMSEKMQQKQVVITYENKNALSKLLSSKKPVERALANQSAIDKRLLDIIAERNKLSDLKNTYAQQCKEIEILNAQISALAPSKTSDYWKEELECLKAGVENASGDLDRLDQKIVDLRKKTGELEVKIKAGKTVFNSINKLDEKLQQLEKRIKELSDSRQQNYTSCLRILEQEKSLVRAFGYSIMMDEPAACYSELCDLYIRIKSETDTYDYDSTCQRKEDSESSLTSIIQQINEIQAKLQELEKQVIEQAKIIGVTLAKSYLSDVLRQRTFDTVILDEASMAPIPALWCASYLAEKSLVIVGDFLQLPPICLAKTQLAKEWLGKDIFYKSGIQMKARGNGKNHKSSLNNFVMLNKQYRMDPKIAAVANMYYGEYGGLSSPATSRREEKQEEFDNWYAGKKTINNIHLMDTESLHAWVTGVPQGKGHSRLNAISASIDVAIAFKLLENKLAEIDAKSYTNDSDVETEPSVLIIAPYKPHIAYINQLISLEYKDRGFKERPNFIKAGTVHSFQGAEADVVIFDLVVDEPHWKANLFINDEDANETNQKMFNVAITRARFKLFIVGNYSYCQKRAKGNALAGLLNYLIDERGFKKIDAKKALPGIIFAKKTSFSTDQVPKDKMLYCLGESFDAYFKQDLCSFKESAIIFSPFITQNRMAELLPFFIDSINSGKTIVIVTKSLSERGKTEKNRYRQCEEELGAIGVKVVHKKGMHEKVIIFDNEVYWSGSLNPLSFSGSTGEQMR